MAQPTPGQQLAKVLVGYGVPHGQATGLALNEFAGWSPDDLSDILSRTDRTDKEKYPLRRQAGSMEKKQSLLAGAVKWLFPTGNKQHKDDFWVKPELELVRQAVLTGAALCVNRDGEFSLRTEGYQALSHTWSEGLSADPANRGLARWQLQKLFSLIPSEECGGAPNWLWIDSLAIPNGANKTAEEQRLNRECVNMMFDIYTRADGVLVLDAMMLSLRTDDPRDVAAVLLCGTWITRVWTYQEMKMAKEAFFLTSNKKVFSLSTIIPNLKFLHCVHGAPGGNVFAVTSLDSVNSRYKELLWTFMKLQREEGRTVALTDVATACTSREATFSEDQAKAFCGVLKIELGEGDVTRTAIMSKILASQPSQAQRLVGMFGRRRRTAPPRWAPASLTGLTGVIWGDMVWEDRGLRGTWQRVDMCRVKREFLTGKRDHGRNEVFYPVQALEVVVVSGQAEGEHVWVQCLFSREDSWAEMEGEEVGIHEITSTSWKQWKKNPAIEQLVKDTGTGSVSFLVTHRVAEHPSRKANMAVEALVVRHDPCIANDVNQGQVFEAEVLFVVELPYFSSVDVPSTEIEVLLLH